MNFSKKKKKKPKNNSPAGMKHIENSLKNMKHW